MTKPVINRDISITWFLFHDLQTFGRSLENSFPTIPPTTKAFHWPNEDPDNDGFNDLQSKNAFIKTRENIFNLLIIEKYTDT